MAGVGKAKDALSRGQIRIPVVLERVPDDPDELKREARESHPISVAGLFRILRFVVSCHGQVLLSVFP
jgi:hypothetical protein